MIRSAIHRLIGRRPSSPLPYDMFRDRPEDAAAAKRLEKIYHKGQERAWEGKDILAELVAKHGGIHLAPERAEAVRNLFAVILWGELAAWKVSAQLALDLEPLEAKLAATSQAHDEARHFYVMHDYLELIGYQAGELPPAAARTLVGVLEADSLVKKVLGMQLMVEPIALTLFQLTRERRLEPVLADLLAYYERDEARHVALGIHHLPAMLRGLTPWQAADLWTWQLKMFEYEIAGLAELRPSFEVLGIRERDVLRLGMAKQLLAFRMTAKELGHDLHAVEMFKKMYDFRIEFAHPEADIPTDRLSRLIHAMRSVIDDVKPVDTKLDTTEAA